MKEFEKARVQTKPSFDDEDGSDLSNDFEDDVIDNDWEKRGGDELPEDLLAAG